jgi:hypothetical protein
LQSGHAEAKASGINCSLFIDTSLDRIVPFHLSSETVQDILDALSPEKIAEARAAYERQKALEDMFQ